MSPDNARALDAGGHAILAHSHNHPFDPSGFSGEILRQDIETNSLHLEAVLGYRPEGFTYPCGIMTEEYVAELQRAGFKFALTAGEYNFATFQAPPIMALKRIDAAQFDLAGDSMLPFLNYVETDTVCV